MIGSFRFACEIFFSVVYVFNDLLQKDVGFMEA